MRRWRSDLGTRGIERGFLIWRRGVFGNFLKRVCFFRIIFLEVGFVNSKFGSKARGTGNFRTIMPLFTVGSDALWRRSELMKWGPFESFHTWERLRGYRGISGDTHMVWSGLGIKEVISSPVNTDFFRPSNRDQSRLFQIKPSL